MEGGRKDGKGEEWEGRGGEEASGRVRKGKKGRERGGRARLGYLFGGPRVPSYATETSENTKNRALDGSPSPRREGHQETSADSLLAEMYTDVRCGMRTKVAPLQRSICGGGDAVCRYHYCGNLFPT